MQSCDFDLILSNSKKQEGNLFISQVDRGRYQQPKLWRHGYDTLRKTELRLNWLISAFAQLSLRCSNDWPAKNLVPNIESKLYKDYLSFTRVKTSLTLAHSAASAMLNLLSPIVSSFTHKVSRLRTRYSTDNLFYD